MHFIQSYKFYKCKKVNFYKALHFSQRFLRTYNGNASISFNHGYCNTPAKYTTQPIKKILIANRGEIACRVIRTAKKMDIQSVSVFSDPDRNSLHVKMADEAYYIGPAAVQDSYLRGEKILNVAVESGAQAIHPGYGFLSENTEFAEACEAKKVIFIGPPSSAIRDMGIKSTSKSIMSDAGVPVVGGYHGEDQTTEKLLEEARQIGFPVMIKAVRGGGGKGMRICMEENEFLSQLNSAKTEGIKSFGDDVMLIEKFIQNPRHVEVQVFGDKYDNYVYLYERDCSVQRRHQKIIEEAPAPGVTPEVRKRLGEAAVRAARAVNYVGAGTVEFILDPKFDFFFMEMNTRLQVEHPVTEMITGTDLVEWQIRVASGERLPILQDQLPLNGHSFEARIYAEDPDRGFLPGAGPLTRMVTPSTEDYVRVETGVTEGDEVSVHYDPMIAKLVVWGSDRRTALTRLVAALSDFNVVGLSTNIGFLMSLSQHPNFENGDVHTDFITQHFDELFPQLQTTPTTILKAVLAVLLNEDFATREQISCSMDPTSPFTPGNIHRVNHSLQRTLHLSHKEKTISVEVTYKKHNEYTMSINGITYEVSGKMVRSNGTPNVMETRINGNISSVRVIENGPEVHLFSKDGIFKFTQPEPKFKEKLGQGTSGPGGNTSPMPGVIEKVCVEKGQTVSAGEPLVVIIAMKMEYVIKAASGGIVEEILHRPGENVPKDALLVKVKASPQEDDH